MFNPVAESLAKLIDPLATELRQFGDELIGQLRMTNHLLATLVEQGKIPAKPKSVVNTTPKK